MRNLYRYLVKYHYNDAITLVSITNISMQLYNTGLYTVLCYKKMKRLTE